MPDNSIVDFYCDEKFNGFRSGECNIDRKI